jgi:peptide-methionine (S)-S-oxide reductase
MLEPSLYEKRLAWQALRQVVGWFENRRGGLIPPIGGLNSRQEQARMVVGQGTNSRLRSGKGEKNMEKATFGAGCFWGVEATFRQIPGVISTAVGYMGGTLSKPTYKDVCTDRTGHAEVVEVVYDPAKVTYDALLSVFWENHDPTTLNRQGPDVGTQYRSVIFFHSPEQEAAAKASKEVLERSGAYKRPIVTEIVPAAGFWRAEEYHQAYLEKRGLAQCHIK